MSADMKTAVMQHALNMGDLFAQNAALVHGLPDKPPRPTLKVTPDGPLTLRLETNQPLATATATAHPAEVAPTSSPATAPVANSASGWLKNAAMIAALTATGGGLGTAAGYFMRPAGGPTINVQQSDQGLLQYLQEQGYHLPAKGKLR